MSVPSDVPRPYRSSSVPPDLGAGQRIGGKYELVRKLGTGAMGEVWAARHLSLEEEVAIKLVMRNIAHDDGTTTEGRFLLEARVAANLSRKTRHIVAVTDHGEDGPYAYLVMDLLQGESLDVRLMRTGPLSLSKSVPIVYQIARALSVAHGDGIVHRDLKPSNVFVTTDEDGRAILKILDFGIAKLKPMGRAPLRLGKARLSDAGGDTEPSIVDPRFETRRGFLLGTPPYMSPEQVRAREAPDHRVDVWALGVIAYHLLTGEYPFDGATPEELFTRLDQGEATSILEHRPDLPAVVGDFFRRAFARRIEERFQSAVALAGAFEQLEALAQGTPRAMAAISLPPLARRDLQHYPPPVFTGTPYVEVTGIPGVTGASPESFARADLDYPAITGVPPSFTPVPTALSLGGAPLVPSSRRPSHATPERGLGEPSDGPRPPSPWESSMVAAGVPPKRGLGVRVAAAIVVAVVLLGTGAALSLYFEREPSRAAATPLSPPRAREEIPPPEATPLGVLGAGRDGPNAASGASSVAPLASVTPIVPAAANPASVPASDRVTPALLDRADAKLAGEAARLDDARPRPEPPAAAPRAKPIDKSEVF